MAKDKIIIFGGDGYLGWTLGLAFANRTNYDIVLADNMIKRQWEKEVGAKSLVPFQTPLKRIKEYGRIFGKNNLSFEKIDLLDYELVVKIIRKHNPAIIINAAQQPSAPFSMMNAQNAVATFSNNIAGHINVAWAIAETNKNIKYIKLGSAGCYSGIDTDYIPLGKVNFNFSSKGRARKIKKSWLPMYATDFYHQSKISDFLINELISDAWKLRVVTTQQSTIFGATIDENFAEDRRILSARFNYDAVFGTVINRFVCQINMGWPLTIYGDGSQKTGIISLSDTVDNFINIAEKNLVPGIHEVVHNFTLRPSINEIANMIVAKEGTISISHIENPRKEMKGSLKREVEVHKAIKGSHKNKDKKIKSELFKLGEFVGRYKNNIDAAVIMPKILWEKNQDLIKEKSLKEKYSLIMQQSAQ
ncbi:MAG: hypothetical protein A2599_01510 [Candidatus Staskawiczbacteria bacterium RIFOXYD1_FULL_39_28]|uniref:NAD-dependent epimerase/dehydratase domain-containing protein n=1 Tax=Candidatus Staskawiczbacteria bacterium RIFOXYC1_FULL_38_18 TaxID=1802229 RepID=A0A1G2J9V2_9BACT|nr:MAG: hypothetical protein A2401_00250 [Candidatus Staskawiczbacteria bacterium RIFOXYC1_FULL_38_18]OGZ91995.1 MAG: hypothetical protein A2599_01510 [Candidatus Staskawiczbacteria bacterium RIFOXYD1_FULL_39_28]